MYRKRPVRGIKDFHIKNIMSPKDCQAECMNDDDCNYWTWLGPDIKGTQAKDIARRNTYWLQSGIGQKKTNCKWCHGKVSGPKTCKYLNYLCFSLFENFKLVDQSFNEHKYSL